MVHVWVSLHFSSVRCDKTNPVSGLATKPPIPGVSSVMQGDVFSSSPDIRGFAESVHPNQSHPGVDNDFITSGSYASAPDLGLGWMFGGMVSANRTEIEYVASDEDPNHPTVAEINFMKVTMPASAAGQVEFQRLNWPAGATPRSEGGLVWLPYGEQGVLIAFGGAEIPADMFLTPPRYTPEGYFMTELLIYDIAADQWHTQQTLETTNKPTQLASFCTAVVPTNDSNGYEIFVYGGYDGVYNGTDPNVRDDVWVLSVPAFQWTKFIDSPSTGTTHGRQGSVCIAPNPTSIISAGGSGVMGSTLLEDSIIDVLDLNKKEWTGVYNASSAEPFILPAAMVTQLNYPDGNGPGAQVTGLNATGDLNTLFSRRYSGQVTQNWPYANATGQNNSTQNGTNSNNDNDNNGKHSNTALIASLATVIPIVVIGAIIAFCCVRRRRKNKQGVERTQESRGNVRTWLRKSSAIDPAPEKSQTSDDTVVNSPNDYTHDKQPISEVFEAPGSTPATSAWGNRGNQGNPVLAGSMATSPFMGSAEVDASSRHEIMDHVPREGQSLRQHHMYPRSLSGDQVVSARSDSISHASTNVMPSRHYGYVSPYEMAQDRSRENLAAPTTDVNLGAPRADVNPNSSSHSLGLGAEHVHSPVALMPVAPYPRKPVTNSTAVEDDRPRHQRNQSSMSSDLPNLPSPGAEEDRRRSRLLDTLPEPQSAQKSPVQPQQQAKRSIYKEDLDS
ncbi:hypothetical protein ES702_00147 [subsurface metagenome]